MERPQVQRVGFRASCRDAIDPLALAASQPKPDALVDDRACDLVLEPGKIGRRTVVARTPEAAAARDVDERSGHHEPIAGFAHGTGEHRVDAEPPAGCPDIDVGPLEVQRGAGGPDADRKRSEPAGQSFGQSLREVLGIRIVVGVGKRQHGQGLDGRAGRPRSPARPAGGQRDARRGAGPQRVSPREPAACPFDGSLLPDAAKGRDELARARKARTGIAGQRAREELADGWRSVEHLQIDRRRRRARHDLVNRSRRPFEGGAAREHLVQDHAEGKLIRSEVGRLAARLLR